MAKKIFRKFLESSGIFHQKISQTFLFSKSGVFAKKKYAQRCERGNKKQTKKKRKREKKNKQKRKRETEKN